MAFGSIRVSDTQLGIDAVTVQQTNCLQTFTPLSTAASLFPFRNSFIVVAGGGEVSSQAAPAAPRFLSYTTNTSIGDNEYTIDSTALTGNISAITSGSSTANSVPVYTITGLTLTTASTTVNGTIETTVRYRINNVEQTQVVTAQVTTAPEGVSDTVGIEASRLIFTFDRPDSTTSSDTTPITLRATSSSGITTGTYDWTQRAQGDTAFSTTVIGTEATTGTGAAAVSTRTITPQQWGSNDSIVFRVSRGGFSNSVAISRRTASGTPASYVVIQPENNGGSTTFRNDANLQGGTAVSFLWLVASVYVGNTEIDDSDYANYTFTWTDTEGNRLGSDDYQFRTGGLADRGAIATNGGAGARRILVRNRSIASDGTLDIFCTATPV